MTGARKISGKSLPALAGPSAFGYYLAPNFRSPARRLLREEKLHSNEHQHCPRQDVSLRRDGLALILIFIDHVPENVLSYFTLQAVGFYDAAEVFIFISGFTAALVYGRRMASKGALYRASTAALLRSYHPRDLRRNRGHVQRCVAVGFSTTRARLTRRCSGLASLAAELHIVRPQETLQEIGAVGTSLLHGSA